MGNRSAATREARRLERLYDTKAHGTKHSTILRLLHDVGLEKTIEQLEAWGMRPVGGGHVNAAEEINIVITQPPSTCDGSGEFAYDASKEDGQGERLASPCPGCRACR